MTIQTLNPATGELIKTFSPLPPTAVEARLAHADTAFESWRKTPIKTRQDMVIALARILEAGADQSARMMVLEMGKTHTAAHAEVEKCIQYCRYMAEKTPEYLADEDINTDYKRAFTRPLPLGAVLLIMPWNFPFWQVIRVAVPAILAGNTVLLKHASNVPQCALMLEACFLAAGAPKGVFQPLLIDALQVEQVLADDRVKAASLTGSEIAGSSVAQTCGKYIKKCVLELGGSDPFIVMTSANIDAALEAALTSRMRNNGQSCIAAKRLIIHADIYDDFRDKFLSKLKALHIGNPLHPDTDIGPISSKKARQEIEQQITNAVEDGAKFTKSPHPLPEQGFYVAPAILENITSDMRVFHQEIFGPIALFFKVESFDAAIALANDSPFGLSSVLFSNIESEIDQAIDALEAGSTFINRYASSDIRLPFGGIKRSGYGREMAREGLREFTNLKTVIVAS